MRPLVQSETGELMVLRNTLAKQVNTRAIGMAACAALFVFAPPVVGQSTNEPATVEQSAQGTMPKARITKRDCKRLIRHQARADVAYQPGVDVRGNPVVPADASGGFKIPLPDVFEFNITKDLTTYLGDDEDKLAADKAAAIAAEKTVAATNAAVTSAELSLAGAQTIAHNTAAAAAAAQAAADAAPNDAALAAAAVAAQQTADTATEGLTTTQAAFDATTSASTSNDTAAALAGAQSAKSAAEEIGYVPDATATSAATAAQTTAADAAAADSAAAAAAKVVASSEGMSMNVGTVRFNIKTGGMTFNGKPLNDASMSELAEKCQAMMAAGK
jgi:hypothetical protein